MGNYNLTDRGITSNSSSPTSDSLSAVTYGAIGVGTFAIISIIIAFIYKAIKRARRSSSGGSYSPTSHHKENQETRRSSSNSGGNDTLVDPPGEPTLTTHAMVNESVGETKNSRNMKSKAPIPQKMHDGKPGENTKNEKGKQLSPNIEVLNTEPAYDTKRQHEETQDVDNKKELSTNVANEQNISTKKTLPIDKPPRKNDKVNVSTGKFTSDKTAASNLNENSLRSLGQALGGILKDQVPDGNHKVETANSQNKLKSFNNDSDELTSCTPPTTPTDLSDQEPALNYEKVEVNESQKKSNGNGGDTEGDAFFSSGETEVDAGSEYFSADESSYPVKEATIPASDSQTSYPNNNSNIKKDNLDQRNDLLSEDAQRKLIEEDIANGLKTSTIIFLDPLVQEKLTDIDGVKVSNRHRGITMCEDNSSDMEVRKILQNKEPYDVFPIDKTAKEKKSQVNESVEDIMNEMKSQNLPRNAQLQKIIRSDKNSTDQNNSGLDATFVVDEIISTTKLDFLDAGLVQNKFDIASSSETYESTAYLKEDVLNTENLCGNNLLQDERTTESVSTTDRILDVEILDKSLNEMTSEIHEERNLIDFIVPKHAPVATQTSYFDEQHPTPEGRQIYVRKNEIGEVASDVGESETSIPPPKWYVPFESSPQEITDPTRGNSEGLYIAISEDTKLPCMETASERQATSSGSPKKSCAYIAINGEGGTIDEGWPSHLPRNHHENNMSGLGLLNVANSNGTRFAIQEETAEASSFKTDSAGATDKFQVPHAENSQTSEFLSRENIQPDIPQFQLPNMDKRLMKKRKLKRRQIKSLDSGVHSYYGEYIDLVEFPEFEGEQKMHITNEETNKVASEIKEIKIEEDVVTILPDGSIREEKIVIDKINSTSE